VTMCLSCTVMDIWHLSDFAVTTLTFWGHVTSRSRDYLTYGRQLPMGGLS